jgi:hypothetical protein
VLQVAARARQALDGSRLLLVPQEPSVWLRSFSTAFIQPAIFAAAALSLRSICLLRSFWTAFPQVGNALLPNLVDWYSYNRQLSDRHVGAFEQSETSTTELCSRICSMTS